MAINKIKGRGKKGMELEVLGYWIIGIILLIILVVASIILRGKGGEAITFIKNIFRFGG